VAHFAGIYQDPVRPHADPEAVSPSAEAGCATDAISAHCRSGEEQRGRWVVDLVMGTE
jgi:hypothetical protein